MQPTPGTRHGPASRRRARNELLVIVAGAIAAFLVLARLDAFERFAEWSRRYEFLQLDELLTLAVLVALALAIFAWRRWRELAHEEALRSAAERSAQRLEGLLPICSGCKRIREQDGAWTPVEEYFASRISADFTHGLCPECKTRLYPELAR